MLDTSVRRLISPVTTSAAAEGFPEASPSLHRFAHCLNQGSFLRSKNHGLQANRTARIRPAFHYVRLVPAQLSVLSFLIVRCYFTNRFGKEIALLASYFIRWLMAA